ncbi:MAG: hypothetical protein AB7K52_07045 [Phycisphaerales bacterium]
MKKAVKEVKEAFDHYMSEEAGGDKATAAMLVLAEYIARALPDDDAPPFVKVGEQFVKVKKAKKRG